MFKVILRDPSGQAIRILTLESEKEANRKAEEWWDRESARQRLGWTVWVGLDTEANTGKAPA